MRKLSCAALLIFWAGASAGAQRGVVIFSAPPVATAPATPAAASSTTVNPRQIDPAEGVIQLDVVVTDAAGKPVEGLSRDDFTLMDNDKPAKILTFHENDLAVQKPDAPTELILVLDQLNLNTTDANEAEELLDMFLRQNDGHLVLPTSIYRLSAKGLSATLQPLTNGNALADEIAKKGKMRPMIPNFPYYLNGNSDLSTALSRFALGSITLKAMKKPGRKLVVWIGYGWHVSPSSLEHNFYEITEFSTRMREARIALYRVNAWDDPQANDPKHLYDYRKYIEGAQSEKDASPAKTSLEVLAVQSGGEVLGVTTTADFVNGHPSPEQMAHIFLDSLGRIVNENCNSYSLSIDPPHIETPDSNNHGEIKLVDHYHALKLEFHKPGLVAHTRAGYYNEPVYFDQPRQIPAERLSVAQLEQLLEKNSHESESQLALELSNVELTERMSSAKLNDWKSRLRDKKTQQALVAVTDASAFLEPPTTEIPALPEPSLAEQREQLLRIMHYLGELEPKLPNLLASRTTDRYEEPKLASSETWKTARADRSLHLEASETVAIRYQNGEDTIDPGSRKEKKAKNDLRTIETHGTFGSIRTTVVSDAVYGKITWGGWASGESGPMAVFRYSVPAKQSHFSVSSCCIPEYLGGGRFELLPGYHGTIAFDSASGAILRLTAQADLSEKLPLIRSDVVVEYGPVETGGSTYICPVRSVTITRGRTLRTIPAWGEELQIFGPFETLLTDVSFSNYHRFGSTARILTDVTDAPEK